MNPQVEEIIKKKKEEVEALKQQEKKELLLELGLTTKEYAKNDSDLNEYPYMEEIDGKTVYYKLNPIEISEEDYIELKKHFKETNLQKQEKEIKKFQKYYDTFKQLPNIIFWIMISCTFIGSIVGASMSSESVLVFFISALAGVGLSFLYKWLINVYISHVILRTEYLSLLVKNIDKNK